MKLLLNITAILLIAAVASATDFPRNCEDIQQQVLSQVNNPSNGIYKIFPSGITPNKNENGDNGVEVFCDMETDGGGWTVIQRRKESPDPQEDFYRNWVEYASGFGHLMGSFWLGNDLISKLTTFEECQLRVDLMDWKNEQRFAAYSFFQVANSSNLYRLTVNGFSGSAGDSLSYHDVMAFTTKDNDNDVYNGGNCAVKYHGGWWYNNCHYSNLNGLYGDVSSTGVYWHTWHGYDGSNSMKQTEMKIRSVDFLAKKQIS